MDVSIIIPTLNEAHCLGRLLAHILTDEGEITEIIVVDGGSTDGTEQIALDYKVDFRKTKASRAKQMNLGATLSKGKYLYFLHADTVPPKGFKTDLQKAIDQNYKATTYRSKYEKGAPLLMRLNSFFTRFNWLIARGGDQSLFIEKEYFKSLGMFNEDFEIMEEYPLLETLMSEKNLHIFPKSIIISCRKYEKNSWLEVQRANFKAFKMYKNGMPSSEIKKTYESMLN